MLNLKHLKPNKNMWDGFGIISKGNFTGGIIPLIELNDY